MVAVLGAGAFLPIVPQAQAATGPEWKLTLTPDADYFVSGEFQGIYTVEAENVGDQPTDSAEPILFKDTPPAGTTVAGFQLFDSAFGYTDVKPFGTCPATLECKYPSGSLAGILPVLGPGQRLIMVIHLEVPAALSGPLEDLATISGGGAAAAAQAEVTNAASPDPPFGTIGFDSTLTDSAGLSYTQAGGHPYQYTTEFNFGTYSGATENEPGHGTYPIRDPKEVTSELPAGVLANPQGVPHCALSAFYAAACPLKTVVGNAGLKLFGSLQGAFSLIEPVYNLQPNGAYPGELGVLVGGLPVILITTKLRTGSDYGVTATSVALESSVVRVRLNLWGVPADPSHDGVRGKVCSGFRGPHGQWSESFQNSIAGAELECEQVEGDNGQQGGPAEVEETPFLIMPTECSGRPLTFVGRYNSWQVPGEFAERSTTSPAVDGCNAFHFEPTIEARPTTNLADSPSGFDFDLKVPQDLDAEGLEDPNGLATPSLKEAVVKLPAGLVVNPSSAAGLGACSPAQVGLTTPVASTPAHFTETPAGCPDASKLGTVEVNTQLLHNPLVGSVYLATPHQNPSGNLLAGYIVLEGEGIIIKLAGQFHTDPQTGQITAGFLENPQTPFKEFKFHFFEGARGALRTPPTCGTYQVGSTLTPWSAPQSGPAAEPATSFATTAGPSGGACPSSPAAEPDAPSFHAGTESPTAGIYSPFSLRLVRQDGEQEIKGIETTLPEGLVGKLAGLAECSDAAIAAAVQKSGGAEQASPSCPQSSEVGSVDVASGAGPTPIHVPGRAYLAGPYKGAPLSLAIITPAIAGPFDLGTVVVRTALFVDPLTTQITAKSDPIPTILEGIPLDVRQITLRVNRPNFTLNPTDCEPKQLTGAAFTVLNQTAPLTQRFQVGGCKGLAFKPSLKIALRGSTRHAGHPALEAVLTYPPKGPYANIAGAQVSLPHSEFIDQANLDKTCTRPVLLEGKCPARSIYGKAKAWTPLLDKPLEGPVYLVGGFGFKLPALVAELDGQIRVLLIGKVDSDKERGIRNTFEAVPDAPVSRFVLQMKGGKKYSLLENSENLCAKPQQAKATLTAQNGAVVTLQPTIANSCKGKKEKGHGKSGKGTGRRGAQDLLERLGGW